MVHKAGFGPAGLRFLAGDVFRLHHLCIWYAGRDSNPQKSVAETELSSFASPAHMGGGRNAAPVGHLPEANAPRTNQPKQAERLLQGSSAQARAAVRSAIPAGTEPASALCKSDVLAVWTKGSCQPRRAEPQALLVWSAVPERTIMESKVVPNTAAKTTKLSKVGNVAPRCQR